MNLSNEITNLFTKNRKCIINADLDGLLSGMILHKFLGWKIVGFSSCTGKPNDELWLYNESENIKDCVFVDLPVHMKDYSIIDQHFIAFDKESVELYKNNNNKVNPNIMRGKVFRDETGSSEYTNKYPFGTVHFIIAILENIGVISKDYDFNFKKELNGFDLADLMLRADRVIGNATYYTDNCIDWMKWLIELGSNNTKLLFDLVQKELMIRKSREENVESKIIWLGCKGKDGDCSNMFRNKDYKALKKYFDFLSLAMDMEPIRIEKIFNFGKLKGTRFDVTNNNLKFLKKESLKSNIFSLAFVTMKTLSITYIEGVDIND